MRRIPQQDAIVACQIRYQRTALHEFTCLLPTPWSLMSDTHVGRTPHYLLRDTKFLS
jgi:hypothetical protein